MKTVNLVCGAITLSALGIILVIDWIRPLTEPGPKKVAAAVGALSVAAIWVIGGPMTAFICGIAITAQSVRFWYIN